MVGPDRPLITVGFSSHRLEVLPAALKEMAVHDAVVLEEAPEPDFPEFLAGKLTAARYLEDKEVEFPEFSRRQLKGLRELYRQGKAVLQVEPYLERLLKIHRLLAKGVSREEVEFREEFREIYAAEREAGGALLRFYAAAPVAPFPQVVARVRDFARADAARFRLRDELRARALAPLSHHYPRIYVEAGYIHLYLIKCLVRELQGKARLRPRFLLAGPSLTAIRRPRPLGPGDLLTLHYIFGVTTSPATENLLAARSLIYIKLLEKEELAPGRHPQPHLHDEIRAWRLTNRLAYKDCATLYPQIRTIGPEAAVALVTDYLGGNA